MIKAILFDMNGVIVDDEHVHEMAFLETVKEYNINLTHKEYMMCCAGKTDRRGFEEIALMHQKELLIDALLKQKAQKYFALFPKYKRSYDGVVNLIQTLTKKYILALTSSSSRAEVDLITREFDVAQYFVVTISADDVCHGKPHPEPYLKTAELLHLAPQECMVIEDSASGVHAAKAAGCNCVAITTTHTAKDLKGADIVIDSFRQITEKLINSI